MKTVKKRSDAMLRAVVIAFWILALIPCLGASRAEAMSIDDETILGQKFLESLRRQCEFVDDDFANDYINDLGQYLTRSLETRPFPFHFYLIKDHSLNAFAGPGGHIFVFSGLVEVMDNIDELVSVLAHEIAHVSARHLSERYEQAKKIGIATLAGMLAGILVGGKAAPAIMSGTMAAGIQKQLSYSREDERQADQMGFQYTAQGGFDPSGMIATMTKLEKGQWHGADVVPPYLLTHPGGPERMANMEVMLASYGPGKYRDQTVKYRSPFPFFKTVLIAKATEPHEAEKRFTKELEKDPDSPLAHFGLGMIWQGRSELDRSIQHFKEALKSDPDSLPVLKNLTSSYQLKGQDKEAAEILKKILRSDGNDKSSLFLLARSYENLDEYAQAIRIYERLLLMGHVRNEVFYNLGVSYGRENRLALAHYNFGVYFKRIGEKKKAKFHFEKADDLAKGDAALRSKIQQETMEGLRR
jgi:predicted Zn-dependent protease